MKNVTTITLKMVREFEVPPEKVFEAWLNPELMRKWLFTLTNTNKAVENEPVEGGKWEIIDHREGTDYRAIGEYLEIKKYERLVFTFKMPQFSESEDKLTVEFKDVQNGCEMTFTQGINVPHEPEWTEEGLDKAVQQYHDSTEQGWKYMFMGLKELVETGEVSYKG